MNPDNHLRSLTLDVTMSLVISTSLKSFTSQAIATNALFHQTICVIKVVLEQPFVVKVNLVLVMV